MEGAERIAGVCMEGDSAMEVREIQRVGEEESC